MGGVGSAIAVDLQVGEQRPQGGQFPANGAVGLLIGGELVTPAADVLGTHLGQVLEGTGGDTGGGQELIQVVHIRLAGMRGGGTQQPGIYGPADGFACIAGHLAGKGRDRIVNDR